MFPVLLIEAQYVTAVGKVKDGVLSLKPEQVLVMGLTWRLQIQMQLAR